MSDYSRGDMSYAVRLANRSYDAGMIFRALAQKPSGRREPGSLKYQRILDTKGRDVADAYARRTAERAVAFVADSPPIVDKADAVVRITEIKALADAMPWGLYAGPGARRSLEAAFVVAERIGGVAFGLSLREWAEICGHDLRATQTNRDRLVSLGWLHRNPNDRLGRTARYSLRTPPYIHSHRRSECAGSSGREWLAHDAFREAALGDLSWYLLSLIESRPLAFPELSIRAGIDPAELEDLTGVMTHAGLVAVDNRDIVLARDPISALDEVARRRGTTGRGEADKAKHRNDREAFRQRDVNVPTPQEVR